MLNTSGNSYTFKDRDAVGRSIELRVMDYFESRRPLASIEDVTGDMHYRSQGIDLLLQREEQAAKIGIEVKADELIHKTGNFFFEIESNDKKGTPGWFLYSRASLLTYVSIPEDMMYMMLFSPVRDWVLERKDRFAKRKTHTEDSRGNYMFTTTGLLVPKNVIKKNIPQYMKTAKLDPA
ncbi:MAG: hypothetical protein V1729_06040 [Candidatus Woesearchaeota archaeon]